jgi:hemerythrin
MPSWSQSNSVFLPEIDGEHDAIHRTAGELQQAIDDGAPLPHIQEIVRSLLASTEEHFAHEERLMRTGKYESLAWHKGQHNSARRQMKHYATLVEAGAAEAAKALATFLSAWLQDHAGLTDRMMAAFLRNQKRARS